MHEITHSKSQNAYKCNVDEIIELCNKVIRLRWSLEPDTSSVRVQHSTDMAKPPHGRLRKNWAPQSKRDRTLLTELSQCAAEIDVQLLTIGEMLDTRWVVSSVRTVRAVWQSFAALYQQFVDAPHDKLRDTKERTVYSGLTQPLSLSTFCFNHGTNVWCPGRTRWTFPWTAEERCDSSAQSSQPAFDIWGNVQWPRSFQPSWLWRECNITLVLW